MTTKNENLVNVEAKSTNTNNFRRMGITLFVAIMAIGFSAYTSINKKAVNEVCFTFDIGIDNPTDIQATNPTLYSNDENEPMVCPADPETLCGLCFDSDYFPLVGGKPDFSNLELKSIVESNRYNTGRHDDPILVPGTTDQWVTLHFRKLN